MRLRHIPYARELIEERSDIVLTSFQDIAGKWSEIFGNRNPIHVEIGMGKGLFLFEMARQHPECNFVGIERFDSVLVRALEKLCENPVPNVRLLCMDALKITEYFALGEVGCIYLNFSDPWPKERHAKRRLTHAQFLKRYETILAKTGELWFKTDNRVLFEFSLQSFNEYGLLFDSLSLDLHAEEPVWNVRTEYENAFGAKGCTIYRTSVGFSSRKKHTDESVKESASELL